MSSAYPPGPPAVPLPYRPPPPPPARTSAWPFLLVGFFAFFFICSLCVNGILFFALMGMGFSASESDGGNVREHLVSGKKTATDKIAIVHVDGVIMEGMISFVHKEIQQAVQDADVKAVVIRINSPGGSITASDDLHHRLTELRDGDPAKKAPPKPLVVSMASLTASGGYYISMPAKSLVAEPTTITGSIGVYAALPNVAELGKKIGFRMDVIKAGEVKDSGSPFHDMSDKERLLWQMMVDQSYLRFIQVVEQGRPKLKGKLQEDIDINSTLAVRDAQTATKAFKLTRYRADGGIYTAEEALRYGLIDQIGYQEDAVQVAKQAAGLGENYKVISYERPTTLLGLLFGANPAPTQWSLDPALLSHAATPRVWYLAGGAEVAGWLGK